MNLVAADILAGRVYSAKRPRSVGPFAPVFNDRMVLWIDKWREVVQYDSPTVKLGRKRPVTTMERFLKWAAADVTDQCAPAEWRPSRKA